MLGWTLFRTSFKSSWRRFALISGAVGVGFAVMLLFTAMFGPFMSSGRDVFMSSFMGDQKQDHNVDPVEMVAHQTNWRGQSVAQYELQPTGARLPQLPEGMTRLPSKGEYLVSSALYEAMQRHPADNLGQRFGDKLVGVLPKQATLTRDALVAVTGGISPARRNSVGKVYRFVPTIWRADPIEASIPAVKLIKTVMYSGVVILMLPVLFLLSIAIRLGSIQRARRYSALRLVGATNGQITRIILLEAILASVVGLAVGGVLYLLTRPFLAELRMVGGQRLWLEEITLTLPQVALLIAGTLVLVCLTNWWAMRKVHTSPLGVMVAHVSEKRPRLWRLIPLVLGLGILVWVKVSKMPPLNVSYWLLGSIAICMCGIVLAVPCFTYHLSQLLAKCSRRPVGLISFKYINRHARAISRAVGGIGLAVLAGTFFLACSGGVEQVLSNAAGLAQPNATFAKLGQNSAQPLSHDAVAQLGRWLQQFGAKNLTLVTLRYTDEKNGEDTLSNLYYVAECRAMLPHMKQLDCATPQHRYVAFSPESKLEKAVLYAPALDKFANLKQSSGCNDPSVCAKPATNKQGYLATLALEQHEAAISAIEKMDRDTKNLAGGQITLYRLHETALSSTRAAMESLSKLTYWGLAFTMTVAMISVAISTVAGMLERRRTLYELHLCGMQVGELRRMLIIQAVLPLVAATLLAFGVGYVEANSFLELSSSVKVAPKLPPLFCGIVGGLLVATLVVVAVLTKSVSHTVDPENNQTE